MPQKLAYKVFKSFWTTFRKGIFLLLDEHKKLFIAKVPIWGSQFKSIQDADKSIKIYVSAALLLSICLEPKLNTSFFVCFFCLTSFPELGQVHTYVIYVLHWMIRLSGHFLGAKLKITTVYTLWRFYAAWLCRCTLLESECILHHALNFKYNF